MWFTSGKVRVRLWTAKDLPQPDFSARTKMNANQLPTFRELTHGLGQYPNMVTVRIELDDSFMSDGQGTVCCAHDGWSTSKIEYSGIVHVLAWIFDEENYNCDIYYQNISIYYATNPVLLPTILNLDDFFVTVEVEMLSGDNSGYRFQTAGSAMTNSNNDFGGLVYAYTNSSVQTWVPNEKGHVQFVGYDWGGGVCSSRENVGHLAVKLFTFRDNKTCGIPASYPFSTITYNNVLNNSIARYTCTYGYTLTSGDLVHQCIFPNWIGDPPSCQQTCGIPASYPFTTYTYNDVTNNSIALYTCTPGYTLTAGDLVHQCISLQWMGDPPSCQETCGIPASYPFTILTYNDVTNNSIAVYTCTHGYTLTSGDLVHRCISPQWIGDPPNCQETCGIPTSYPFSTNTYSHLTNNSFVIYACIQGYEMISGDPVHQCRSPQWIGTPPKCHETCGIPTSYPFSTKSYGHVTNNSFVLYKCLHGYEMTSGDPIHTCVSTFWIGTAPICKESCGTQPSFYNTTYSYDDTINGSIAVYKCKSGYFIHSGDTLHECKPPEWTGYPLKCSNELTVDDISKLKEDIKKELLVDRKSTTAYINSKTSAADPRPSSRTIGTVGISDIMPVHNTVIRYDISDIMPVHNTVIRYDISDIMPVHNTVIRYDISDIMPVHNTVIRYDSV
ncbi:CUB and sushi domain-containing protein 2-like [Mytilus californianus]|uniref:CUB and sushi domain-containing protein 2-like n=1 Tax=Mytilus californianus TaxID=6549 RepID=UPI00224530B8|nr:CUB and sushi domain-containing protein 2-like [Mytilus californianus]